MTIDEAIKLCEEGVQVGIFPNEPGAEALTIVISLAKERLHELE